MDALIHRAIALLGAGIFLIVLSSGARADGSVPPQPYRYLHPPPALAPNNNLPQGGGATLSIHGGKSDAGDVFSRDGQAGILAPQGAFSVPASARGVLVSIQPVDSPAALPAPFVSDGNAVRITAEPLPRRGQATLSHQATLVMRWPRLPSVVEIYRGGEWRRVCGTGNAFITSSTFSCHVNELGTFVLARVSATAIQTPSRTSRFAFLGRLIPVIIIAIVVVIAVAFGYVLSRQRRA